MTDAPPGRLSTTTDCPAASATGFCSRRTSTSVVPPGG
ncbi:Uncharacterised protein [Bordetella pertussis]|nr:Uncharacterised protein [Bordetella pertussis]CFP63842.1 Uncharacterised protein [Bordetella pertussis]CFT97338.1 Uncharacterised protein [Bordetella pertussis]CFW38220.1 Uncharacterised protein [Bordetella pertussis]